MDSFKKMFPDIRRIANESLLSGSEFARFKLIELTNVNNHIIRNTIIHDPNNIREQINISGSPGKKGSIIICNHPSFLDFAILQKAFPECYCLTDNVDHNIHTTQEYIDKYRIVPYYVDDENAGDNVKELIRKIISEGKDILVFPEGGVEYTGEINKFKKGLFYLALDHSIPIVCCSLKMESGFKDKLIQSAIYCIGIPVKPPTINLYLNEIIRPENYMCFDDFFVACYESVKSNFESH
jgi:1-acyl-sn-glycerol-3-phosphate acyltransferase